MIDNITIRDTGQNNGAPPDTLSILTSQLQTNNKKTDEQQYSKVGILLIVIRSKKVFHLDVYWVFFI